MNRSENLRYILRTLLDERAEYADWQIPDSLTEQQTMMRTLLNVRPPYPAGEDFLKAQDMEGNRQIKGLPLCLILYRAERMGVCTYGRATSPVYRWTPSSMPPTVRYWDVSRRCSAA